MKRFFALFLVMVTVLSTVSCSAEGQEISKQNYVINTNNNVDDGLSKLKDLLATVYENDDDIVELGRDPVSATVDFDDALLLVGDEYSLPLRLFYYIMVELKGNDINNIAMYGINVEDEAAFWDTLVNDKDISKETDVLERGLNTCYEVLASMYAYKDYGLDEDDSYLESYENILSFFGNEAALEEYYSAYGLSVDYLKMYLRYNAIQTRLYHHLVGLDGILYPDKEQLWAHFEDDCVYMHQIVFSYVQEDDYMQITYKSQEEIEALRAEGEALYAEIIENPKLYERNMYRTQHPEWASNAGGYLYVPGDIQEVLVEAYSKLTPGEITAVDTPIGYYIIQSIEKNEEAFNSSLDGITQSLCAKIYTEEMTKYYSNFTIDMDQYNRYDFNDIITFFYEG